MKRLFSLLAALIFVSTFAGCGGGGGSDPQIPVAAPTTLSGTAAAGAPIIGQVTVKGSLGETNTALIEANGNYTVDVTGLTAPYRLRAKGTVGGVQYQLHSYAEEADLGNTVNITPFTDLIVANTARQLASDFFDSSSFSSLDQADLAEQETALQTKLQAVFTSLGVETAIDLLRTAFSADHTAVDAALDILRIETDTTSNVATITNLIDGTSIEDLITDTTDNSNTLVVNTDLAVAVTTRQAVFNSLDAFSALFATALPRSAQLGQLLSDDFLHVDMGKAQTLTEWTTDPTMVGLSFRSAVIDAFDEAAGTAAVSFQVSFNGVLAPEVETWSLTKVNGAWLLSGNQEIVDRSFNYICATNIDGEICGINLSADDFDPANNNDAGVLIDSAKVSLMRAGSPVSGGVVYMGVPAGGAAGELRIYDADYNNDFMAFGSKAFEIDPSLFQAGDELQFELFTAPLDLTDPAAPVVTGTAIAMYSTAITSAPVTVADSPSYPSATQSTLTAFDAYTTEGGNLTIGWTIPTGQTIGEVLFQVCDNSTCLDEYKWVPSATETTLNIDTSSLTLADAPYRTELRVYSADPQGRTFLHQYYGTASAPNVPPTVGFTAQLLNAISTIYIQYPTEAGGTSQETINITSSNGVYLMSLANDDFDANGDLILSEVPVTGPVTLEQDGSLRATYTEDGNDFVLTWELQSDNGATLVVNGSEDSIPSDQANIDSWQDVWTLNDQPAGWIQ